MQCEYSNSYSVFVLFTLGMKWAPATGALVEWYGDAVSREGHFSEDTNGRAMLKSYRVTRASLVLQSNQNIWKPSGTLMQDIYALTGLAVLEQLLIRDSRKEPAKNSKLSPTAILVNQKTMVLMTWRPNDSVAATDSTETAKAGWSLAVEHPSVRLIRSSKRKEHKKDWWAEGHPKKWQRSAWQERMAHH